MTTLHLTLKKQWFNMIASGEKKEEYREVKPYWITRLSKKYDNVIFKNGYSKDAPQMRFKVTGINVTHGFEKWGAPEFDTVFVISLGDRIS